MDFSGYQFQRWKLGDSGGRPVHISGREDLSQGHVSQVQCGIDGLIRYDGLLTRNRGDQILWRGTSSSPSSMATTSSGTGRGGLGNFPKLEYIVSARLLENSQRSYPLNPVPSLSSNDADTSISNLSRKIFLSHRQTPVLLRKRCDSRRCNDDAIRASALNSPIVTSAYEFIVLPKQPSQLSIGNHFVIHRRNIRRRRVPDKNCRNRSLRNCNLCLQH